MMAENMAINRAAAAVGDGVNPNGTTSSDLEPPSQDAADSNEDINHLDDADGKAANSAHALQSDGTQDPPSLWVRVKAFFHRLKAFFIRLQGTWWPEFFGLLSAGLFFAGEIILVDRFNGKPVSTWPWNWSLNSAVALLTTGLETALGVTIVSCLGQLKWHWFWGTGEQELIWLDQIATSSTALGATVLLFNTTTWK